jgi:uncharacterized protein (TIGR02145 family)
MNKKNLKIAVLFILIVFACNSCKKDDNSPENPYKGKTTTVFNPNVTYGTMTDQDGNEYKTVTIGTQTWMAENLRTTKYRDGSAIPNVTNKTEWKSLTTGAYCTYNNTENVDTIATYGRLYNWYTIIDNRNIAPEGWHVPTDAEWKTLEMFLGMNQTQADEIGWRGTDQGKQLAETGNTHWYYYSGTNLSGFSALPAGYREDYFGSFWFYTETGLWWLATDFSETDAFCRCLGLIGLSEDREKVFRGYNKKKFGCSIRCIRD